MTISNNQIQYNNGENFPLVNQLSGRCVRNRNVYTIHVANRKFKGEVTDTYELNPNTTAFAFYSGSNKLRDRFKRKKLRVILPIFDEEANSLRYATVKCSKIKKELNLSKNAIRNLVMKNMLLPAINANLLRENLSTIQDKTYILLSDFRIDCAHYNKIVDFYQKNLPSLLSGSRPVYIKRSKYNHLPLSVIYIPEGRRRGLYIKTNSWHCRPLGVGSINKVWPGIDIDRGRTAAIRTGAQCYVPQQELVINSLLEEIDPDQKYFLTGTPVFYNGSWRSRDDDFHLEKPLKNVEKVAIVMDMISGGDLCTRLIDDNQPPLNDLKRFSIALHLAEGVDLLHKNDYIDMDFKIENILLTERLIPKMCDFGGVFHEGQTMGLKNFIGSPGSFSPEVVDLAINQEEFDVVPGCQMWLFGCVLAKLFDNFQFDEWADQHEEVSENVLDIRKLDLAKSYFFPEREEEGTIDWCISRCLEYNPHDRITAEELIPYLEALLENALSEETSFEETSFEDSSI